MVCLKKTVLWWRNNISFKDNTENVVYIITGKKRLDRNYCQVQGRKNLVHASTMHQMSFSGEQNIMQENDSYVHLKMERIISGTHLDFWKKYPEVHISSLWCSQAPKVSTKYRQNCVPKIPFPSTLKLYSCKLVVFTDINTYILIEDRNFKTLWKKLWDYFGQLLRIC